MNDGAAEFSLRVGKITASCDQLGATLAAIAGPLGEYRVALEEAGFDSFEAMELVVPLHAKLLALDE